MNQMHLLLKKSLELFNKKYIKHPLIVFILRWCEKSYERRLFKIN